MKCSAHELIRKCFWAMQLHLFAASPSQGNPTRLGCGKLPKPGCPAVSLTSKNPSPVTAISGDLGVVSLHGWQLLAPFQIFAQRKPTAAWTKSGRSVACPWGLYQAQINCGSPAVSTPWSRLPKECSLDKIREIRGLPLGSLSSSD